MTDQATLRDEILAVILPWLEGQRKPNKAAVEAAAALMGAAAVVIGAMNEPSRAGIAAMVTENLLGHANQRAREIRSGSFDYDQARLRN